MLEFIVLGQVPGTEIYLTFDIIGPITGSIFTIAVLLVARINQVKHKRNSIAARTI